MSGLVFPRALSWVCVALPALVAGGAAAPLFAAPASTNASCYAKWQRGPSSASSFFPLAVWLQAPTNAERYKQAGINTYVGLWEGPTEEQLAALKQAHIRVVCEQNAVALRHLDDPTIAAWMHGDEPDNAQPLAGKSGWGPPIVPEKIVEDYQRFQANDPSRPVMLNLGQGVAWDGWYGRGSRSNNPEDYPQYLKGCDIVSFDIYPAVHDRPEVAGKLWFVGQGVKRLVEWGHGKKVIWNCIECTRISNLKRKPTPHEVRCEAWMSLIHGSQGLIYFVHQFKPTFREAALLDDPEMLEAVTGLNRQITELAPVLNSPTLEDAAVADPANATVPIACMAKRHEGATYLFTVAMRDRATKAIFTLKGVNGEKTVDVLGEKRTLTARNGVFSDEFGGWDVHLYRLPP
jgi:hypothetical protein